MCDRPHVGNLYYIAIKWTNGDSSLIIFNDLCMKKSTWHQYILQNMWFKPNAVQIRKNTQIFWYAGWFHEFRLLKISLSNINGGNNFIFTIENFNNEKLQLLVIYMTFR